MIIGLFGHPKFWDVYSYALNAAGHEVYREFEKEPIDIGVIAYYGKIIPKEILSRPKYGFLNIHPSLLPLYRGPSPVRSAILAGEKVTGITIHITTPKVDAGDIIIQKEFPINPEDNYEILEKKLFFEGAKLLAECILPFSEGNITPQKQDESKATYTKIFETKDARIDWSNRAEYISNQIRALSPNPGTHTFWNGKRLIILKASFKIEKHDHEFGKVFVEKDKISIAAKDGYIFPRTLKLEGRKEIPAESFLRGHANFAGAILE